MLLYCQYMSVEQFPQQPEAFSDTPFAEFVTKTVNGCNMQPQHESERDPLALVHPGCDHCYMYTQSTLWQQEPPFMEPEVLAQTAVRIAEHAQQHSLPHVRIIAHGGEPLLALTKDPDYYSRYAEIFHDRIDPTGTKVHLFMQTNGLLINERRGPKIIEQLKAADFTIGLSIDGNQAANDLHRRDKAGRSTHSRAEKAAHLLAEHQAQWGILGVIDPRNNPEQTIEYLASLNPPSINLFPLHANNSAPAIQHPNAITLGEWQKRAFDHYNNWPNNHPGTEEPPFTMPIYDNYLRMAFGAQSTNDTAGARETQELFITPSGKWERLDTLKSASDGAVVTGLNIFEHSLDDVRRDPGIIARRMGFSALSPICQGCEVLNLCFGNHYPNRYKEPEQPLSPQSSVEDFVQAFRNPSGHCNDHKIFLSYISEIVERATRKQPTPTEPASADIEQLTAQLSTTDIVVPDDARELFEAIPEKTLTRFGQTTREAQRVRIANAHFIVPSIVANPYVAFPSSSSKPHTELAAGDIIPLRTAILNRTITGRIALEQIRIISQQHEGGKMLFGAYGEDRMPDQKNYVGLFSEDYNDAIIHALLDAKQPYLVGSDVVKEKAGNFWFVGNNTMQKVIEAATDAQGYILASRVPWDQPKNSWLKGAYGIDYSTHIGQSFIPRTIPVSAYDLPQDLLIVDTIEPSIDQYSAVQRVASLVTQYANPQMLADDLAQEGITITPLSGAWPTEYGSAISWQPNPAAAQLSTTHLSGIVTYDNTATVARYRESLQKYEHIYT